MNSASLGDDSASWARALGIESRSDSASRMGELGESYDDELGLDEWKNNSKSLMKISVDSASRFLDSASLMKIVVDSASHDAKPPTSSG